MTSHLPWFTAWGIEFSSPIENVFSIVTEVNEHRRNNRWLMVNYDVLASEIHLWNTWYSLRCNERDEKMVAKTPDTEFIRILSGTNVRILKRSDAGLGFAAQVANFNIDGACDLWHNGTKRIETTSSGATLTGNLTLDGAIYLPQEIAHYGDTDTNITFPAADTIAFDTGGTERLRINSSGQVSIGNNPTVASDAALHIELDGTREYLRLEGDGGTSNAYIELEAPNNRRKAIIFKSGGTRRGVIGVGDSDEASATSLFFSASSNIAGNSPHMVIDSSGRVLIGTTTEGNESADELTVASSGNTGITIRSGTSSNASIFFTDATSGADEYRGFVQYIQSDDVLKFGTATNERLRITSNGELIQYQNAGAADAAATGLAAASPGVGVQALRRADGGGTHPGRRHHQCRGELLPQQRSAAAVCARAGGRHLRRSRPQQPALQSRAPGDRAGAAGVSERGFRCSARRAARR